MNEQKKGPVAETTRQNPNAQPLLQTGDSLSSKKLPLNEDPITKLAELIIWGPKDREGFRLRGTRQHGREFFVAGVEFGGAEFQITIRRIHPAKGGE